MVCGKSQNKFQKLRRTGQISRRGISASRTSSYATASPLGDGKEGEGWLEQDKGSLLNLITGQYSGNSSLD